VQPELQDVGGKTHTQHFASQDVTAWFLTHSVFDVTGPFGRERRSRDHDCSTNSFFSLKPELIHARCPRDTPSNVV